MSYIRKFNVITMPIVPKWMYKYNASTIKMVIGFSESRELDKLFSKVYVENKHSRISRRWKLRVLKEDVILPNSTKYYEVAVIEFVFVYPW